MWHADLDYIAVIFTVFDFKPRHFPKHYNCSRFGRDLTKSIVFYIQRQRPFYIYHNNLTIQQFNLMFFNHKTRHFYNIEISQSGVVSLVLLLIYIFLILLF